MLVFDVNETLLDIESMASSFERIFGDRNVLREWFNQLVLHSMAATLSGHYADFLALADAVLKMVADVRHVPLSDGDRDSITEEMRALPAHPDVPTGLEALSSGGFRLAALTNSPPGRDGSSALNRAGLASSFERQFSVDAWRVYKPATQLYIDTARELGWLRLSA
jgi:2-haloacid dehalogenase